MKEMYEDIDENDFDYSDNYFSDIFSILYTAEKKKRHPDETPAQSTLFKALFFIYLICFIFGISISVLILINSKKSKVQLSVLYFFANLTLLGKYFSITLNQIFHVCIGRLVLFLDAFKTLSHALYLFFASFSTYSFLTTVLAYILFTLDQTNVTRKVHLI